MRDDTKKEYVFYNFIYDQFVVFEIRPILIFLYEHSFDCVLLGEL